MEGGAEPACAERSPTNSGARFGYVKTEDGTFKPDPRTGPVLRDLYLRYTACAGFQALTRDLNERGFTSTRGNEWIVQSLPRALDSGFGAGLLVRNRTELAEVGHEAVITPAEWTGVSRRPRVPTIARTAPSDGRVAPRRSGRVRQVLRAHVADESGSELLLDV